MQKKITNLLILCLAIVFITACSSNIPNKGSLLTPPYMGQTPK